MTADGRSALAPGLRVRPWRHHLAPWDLASRIAIHAGATETAGRLEPAGPARPPTPEELALLDGVPAPAEPALEVFTSPELLRTQFWGLDPDELPGGRGEAPPSAAWQGFAAEVRAFLKVARAPLPPTHALLLSVRDPAEAPGLWEGGAGRTLLHAVPSGPVGADAQAACAAWLNLSDVPTALVFFNLPLGAMVRLLGAGGDRHLPQADGLSLLTAFVRRFPRCPLVRLTLRPGDGALIPLLGLAIDGDPRGAADLDVSLAVLPGPAHT